jgi:hypothetical protein
VSCGRTRTTERQYLTVQTLQRQASGKVDLISRSASRGASRASTFAAEIGNICWPADLSDHAERHANQPALTEWRSAPAEWFVCA